MLFDIVQPTPRISFRHLDGTLPEKPFPRLVVVAVIFNALLPLLMLVVPSIRGVEVLLMFLLGPLVYGVMVGEIGARGHSGGWPSTGRLV